MKRRLLACLLCLPLVAAVGAPDPRTPGVPQPAQFLSVAEARSTLTAGPEAAYFAPLTLADLRAKSTLPLENLPVAQARDIVRERYAEDVRPFTPDEQAMLRDVLSRLMPKIARLAPFMARTPFAFIKTAGHVEGGAPHTRGTAIVLSQSEIDALMRMYRWGWTTILDQMAAPLLVHEQVHVLQRAEPQRFVSLYTEVLGFRHLDPVPDHPWLLEHRATNPDAQDLGWIYRTTLGTQALWIRPDLLLRKVDHPDLTRDVRLIGIELKETDGTFAVALDDKGRPRIQDLASIGSYRDAFPNRTENYHPNEISADLIAGWITGHPEGNPDHVLRKKIVDWGRSHLQ